MPKLAKALSALEVGRITAAGVHAVGHVSGLQLSVSLTGARSWLLRATVGVKRREIGLGAFPQVKLAEAVQKAREARDKIAAGTDPVEEKRAAAERLKAEQLARRDFSWCVTEFLKTKTEWRNAKHRAQWHSTLDAYAGPVIGSMDVRLIDTPHIQAILSPIWATKHETATRLRGRIEQVLDWATVSKHREGLNPARWRGHLDVLMGRSTVKPVHMRSVPYAEIGALIPRLIATQGMGALALRFAILCASRSGEVRGMLWSEVDMVTGLWTIPAGRMKAKREHVVPMPRQAVELLRSLPKMSGSELVFWGPSGKALSDMTLSAVLRRLGVDATVHGFRSTFRMWAAERTNYPREVAEAALAHVNGDRVEAAYQRGSFMSKRKEMMAGWADFCDQPPVADGGAQIISIRAAA